MNHIRCILPSAVLFRCLHFVLSLGGGYTERGAFVLRGPEGLSGAGNGWDNF